MAGARAEHRSARYQRPSTLSHPLSLPGLTRQSIRLNEALFTMDARVKPAHDESNCRRYESEGAMEELIGRIVAFALVGLASTTCPRVSAHNRR
jgi:hypothetical protein